MLVNHVVERLADLRPRTRELARRARGGRRRPLVIVPSILGTKLVDARGEVVWGDLRRLYAGPPLADAVATAGLLTELSIISGVLAYDVFGGLVRFLERVGGYREGRDVHVLAYDWRRGVPHAAEQIAARVDRIGREVDVACVSTGGLAARYWLAASGTTAVQRIVYIGTPHRGSFSALWYLVDGVRPAPLGRRFAAREVATLQTAWDALPHPDEPVFVDTEGRALAYDLYDPDTWRRTGIAAEIPDLESRLTRARDVWRVLDGGHQHPPAYAIGSRHLPTASRAVVDGCIAHIPPCTPPRFTRSVPGIYEPGDSAVPARSLYAAPGLVQTIDVRPSEHRMLPADREVHHALLGVLLERTNGARS